MLKKNLRLLFVTQKIDSRDPVLGFTVEWVRALARKVKSVVVICLSRGEFDLPGNVEVYSLGKEKGVSKAVQVKNFLALVSGLRGKYDKVFVHMTPVWVVVGAPVFKLLGKDVYLWYTHRAVPPSLRIAEKVVRKIFTAAKESINLKSRKVVVLGHGIPSGKFVVKRGRKLFDVVAVGRITPIKDQLTLVRAVRFLKDNGLNVRVGIVGDASMPADRQYKEQVLKEVSSLNVGRQVSFRGFVPYDKISRVYAGSLVNVNLCPTGGIDKAVVEGVLAGSVPVVCNRAFAPFLGKYRGLLFEHNNAESLASKVAGVLKLGSARRTLMMKYLKKKFIQQFDLDAFMRRLVDELA